jgi:hypothetical protein
LKALHCEFVSRFHPDFTFLKAIDALRLGNQFLNCF